MGIKISNAFMQSLWQQKELINSDNTVTNEELTLFKEKAQSMRTNNEISNAQFQEAMGWFSSCTVQVEAEYLSAGERYRTKRKKANELQKAIENIKEEITALNNSIQKIRNEQMLQSNCNGHADTSRKLTTFYSAELASPSLLIDAKLASRRLGKICSFLSTNSEFISSGVDLSSVTPVTDNIKQKGNNNPVLYQVIGRQLSYWDTQYKELNDELQEKKQLMAQYNSSENDKQANS